MGRVPLKLPDTGKLDAYGPLANCLHGEMGTPGGLVAWGKDGAGPGREREREGSVGETQSPSRQIRANFFLLLLVQRPVERSANGSR